MRALNEKDLVALKAALEALSGKVEAGSKGAAALRASLKRLVERVDIIQSRVGAIDEGSVGADGADGASGPVGPVGPAGPAGADGQGVPAGGTAGQVLEKIDATDFNTQWTTLVGGGGSPTWGGIIGTLSDQTDLQNALDGKVDDAEITGFFEAGDAANFASLAILGETVLQNIAGSNALTNIEQLDNTTRDTIAAEMAGQVDGLTPAGGTVGQVLQKVNNGDFLYAWQTLNFAPTSHTHVEADITDLDKYTTGVIDGLLSVKVAGPGSATAGNIPQFSNSTGKDVSDSGVPVSGFAGGSAGQVLTKDTATDYDYSWQSPGGNAGRFYQASTGASGFVADTVVPFGTSGGQVGTTVTNTSGAISVGNISGNVMLHVDVTTDEFSGNGRTEFEMRLQRDNGGGTWVDIPGTVRRIYSRLSAQGAGTGSITVPMFDLDQGEAVRCVVRRASGSSTGSLLANGCSFTWNSI